MKRRIRFLQIVASLSLVLALVFTGVAYAITITVDGVREAVWDAGQGGQLPGIQSDPNEGIITDGYDIEEFLWTNDQTTMYFLIQTYAATIWTGNPVPTLVICIDTDNNTATGGSYANCNGMTGIDRSIVRTRSFVEVYDGDPNTGTLIGSAVTQDATSGTVTEISVDLNSMGMNSITCIQNMPTAIYFDNGIGDPDDTVPDNGTFNTGCGSPTAITLSDLNAQSTPTNWVAILLAAAALVVVVGLGTLALSRRQA